MVVEVIDTLASGPFSCLTALTIDVYFKFADERFAEVMADAASRQRFVDGLGRLPSSLEHISLRLDFYTDEYTLERLEDVESMVASFSEILDTMRARIVDPERPAFASIALQRGLPQELLGRQYPPSIKTLLRALVRSLLSFQALCEARGVEFSDGAPLRHVLG